jgi:hypothetical protein
MLNCQKKGHFSKNFPKSRKGHKGKFHVVVIYEEEGTYKRNPREVSSDQEIRKNITLFQLS